MPERPCLSCGCSNGISERFCAGCGKVLPRFVSDDEAEPRSLAWSPAEGEEHFSTFFQADGVERVVRKVVGDLDEGTLDLDAYVERVHAMAAFVEERLQEIEAFLEQVREFARRERQQDVLGGYEVAAGEAVQAIRDGFGHAFGRMLDHGHEGDEQAVEDAVASAVEAMEHLTGLDRMSEEAHQALRGLGYDRDEEAEVDGAASLGESTQEDTGEERHDGGPDAPVDVLPLG